MLRWPSNRPACTMHPCPSAARERDGRPARRQGAGRTSGAPQCPARPSPHCQRQPPRRAGRASRLPLRCPIRPLALHAPTDPPGEPLILLPRLAFWPAGDFAKAARASGQPSDERPGDGEAKCDEGIIEVPFRPRTRPGGLFSSLWPRGEKPARAPQRGTHSRRVHRSRGVASRDTSGPRSGPGPARL